MAAKTVKAPHDEDATWWLQCGESVLGRSTAYREGGNGSPSGDHENSVTNRRFGLGPAADGDVTRARALWRRWRALPGEHRDTLTAAYGTAAAVVARDIQAASNLETWQFVERAFAGGLAPLALHLSPLLEDSAAPKRRNGSDTGGIWRTARGRHLLALCVARGAGLEESQGAVSEALDAALLAWRGALPPRERERRVAKWEAPPVERSWGVAP